MLPAILAALTGGGEAAAAAGEAVAASRALELGRAAGTTGDELNSLKGKMLDTKFAAQDSAKAQKDNADAIQLVQGKIGQFGDKFQNLGTTLTDTLTVAATALKSFADPINQLVALANPAPVQQFTLAFRDTLAVIGRALMPITEALTRAMRTVGDSFARLEPMLHSVAVFIGEMIDSVFKGWDDAIEDANLMLNLLVVGIKMVAATITVVVKALLWLGSNLLTFLNPVLGLLGGRIGIKEEKGASSFGAAVRDISTTSQGEDISRKAIEKALMAAMGGQQKKDTPDLLENLITLLSGWWDELSKFLGRFPTMDDVRAFLNDLWDRIKEALPQLPKFGGAVASGAAGGAAGAGDWLGRAARSALLGS